MKQKGISLIEVIVSIAIIGGTIVVFAILLGVLKINKTGSLYTSAYKLAQEELEAVRALPFSGLLICMDAPFINVLYNNGNPGASGGALEVSASGASMGIISLPYNNMADFTLETNVKSSSLTNKNGFLFRARDTQNYYFYYFTGNELGLLKNINGTETSLYQTSQSFSIDTYYKLKVVLSGTNISLYLNDNLTQTVSDSSFSSGRVALASANTTTNFDDVTLDSATWNFNDLTAGALPSDWQRFGINDLPNGSGKLTISELYGSPDMKQIDVTVSWSERGETKTISLSTMRSE